MSKAIDTTKDNEDGLHREEHRNALNRIEEKVRSCFYYQTDSLKALKQIRDICDEEIAKDEKPAEAEA